MVSTFAEPLLARLGRWLGRCPWPCDIVECTSFMVPADVSGVQPGSAGPGAAWSGVGGAQATELFTRKCP